MDMNWAIELWQTAKDIHTLYKIFKFVYHITKIKTKVLQVKNYHVKIILVDKRGQEIDDSSNQDE